MPKKYANKVGMMHKSKDQHIGKAHPYNFSTLQLDSAWESSKNVPQVHQTYWQFMAVALIVFRPLL